MTICAKGAHILLGSQSCASKEQTYNISTKKLRAKLTYVKAAHRTLVKLIPGEIDYFSLRRQNAEEAFFLLNAANPLRINPMKNQSENLFI